MLNLTESDTCDERGGHGEADFSCVLQRHWAVWVLSWNQAGAEWHHRFDHHYRLGSERAREIVCGFSSKLEKWSLNFPWGWAEMWIMFTCPHLSKTTVPFEPTAKSGSPSLLRSNDDWLMDRPKNFSPGLTSEAAILYRNGNGFILFGTILFRHIQFCRCFWTQLNSTFAI